MLVDKQLLLSVAEDVFEKMVFMPVAEKPVGIANLPFDVKATVEFKGPIHGVVSVIVQKALLRELVISMLGDLDDSQLTQTQKYDALGELANVLCGNLLAKMIGPTPIFMLDVPCVEELSPPIIEWVTSEDSFSTVLMLEQGQVGLHVSVQEYRKDLHQCTASARQ